MVVANSKGKMRYYANILVLVLLLSLLIIVSVAPTSRSQIKYRVDKEWVQIWVNEDGSIDILYNVTITYTLGFPEGIVTIGMPKRDFQIQYAQDIDGRNLEYQSFSENEFYGVDIQLSKPIELNKQYTVIVYATVSEMLYKDEANPGNVGLKFYPSTFDTAEAPISNIRVAIALPKEVKENEVKYLEGREFNGVYRSEENLLVYWEVNNWPAYEEFWVGVSFPEKYVNLGPDIWDYILIGGSVAAFFTAMVIVVVLAYKRLGKAEYEKPRIAIEALGPARGLTAVEAAVVLDLKPVKVLTMILFGLLLKRAIMILSTDPIIRLKKLIRSENEPINLRYYEIDFLQAIGPDGSLDDELLAKTYLNLRDTVNLKIRGFSRIDTINYYKAIVSRAWQQVIQANTPELRCKALEENMEWLLADEEFEEKLKVAFPPDVIIYPRPDWWWYWHWPTPPRGQPPTRPPGGEGKPISIPGQDFANNIVLALQKAANNIVSDVQEFANRLVPAQKSQAKQRPLRFPSCVCACASCACACACVSCACACAHGGAR